MEGIPFKVLLKEKFPQLSAGQKKVANYLIENLDKATFQTAYQIGRKAEVSETTVIRFSFVLGFEGFSEMQAIIQKQHLQQNKTDLSDEAISHESNDEKDTFTKVIENEVLILRHLLNPINVQDIWKAVDALIEADQILIAGHGISYVAANWFSHMLGSIRGNVSLCSPAGDFFEKFCNLTDKSAVVVFSFPRYAKDMLKIAECTKEQGISLISVTDRLLSPVGRISDITLTTEENVEIGTNSIASVISLLDLVIAGIYEKDQKRIQIHQQRLEKLYSNYEVFVE
ncbi:MurR/RpiR family transcriptional regulator [Cytobacillus depressus]|uniref:MurR/RpiR family transcriptional regulator n=1 Tax=Cytobacillus depressus TaxID=1602942 RepID=A0A6L3V4Q6_9BACI|nr:MurR/RpiR family transcriptional regulator [Cytobacillus depressus]KAB2334432.1 MurR/RpiR family transcriptional regulator [Cytobacillus depressus]